MDPPPTRAPPLPQLGVVSFPVGKLFQNGKPAGSYLGGPTAVEIAQDLAPSQVDATCQARHVLSLGGRTLYSSLY